MLDRKLVLSLIVLFCLHISASDKLFKGLVGLTPFAVATGICYTMGLKPDFKGTAKDVAALLLGTVAFVIPSACIYEIGKTGYISYLTAYLKKADCRVNFTVKVNTPGKLKIGIDIFVWGASALISAGIWNKLPTFAKHNYHWVFGTMFLGQLLVSGWAQQTILPHKYNPFIWPNLSGNYESVLFFPPKWGPVLRGSNGDLYKKLL